MKLSHFIACLNDAVSEGYVKYDVFPFARVKMPKSKTRDLDITLEEFIRIKNLNTCHKNLNRLSIFGDYILHLCN
jgi:hypothetical protein